jgi:hypothetical protein
VKAPGSDDKSPTTGLTSCITRNGVTAPDSDDKSLTAGLASYVKEKRGDGSQ